ncbi:hypothetical protein DU478_04970 [Thalassococcus profundi]|uniref:AAA+ family ATPase n=1 Tax=Thalassococcus profundi TaxID=2282382 RepID=A0A369TVV7_9RHOB|nr:hypothetical protein [Thalassococcus profundi]RDD67096.1 hypothetical protein DU478_04970 [Thalassococcus profundi]
MTRAALILALALPLSPLAAQETPEPLPETEEEEGFDLIEEGAKMFFRGMMQEMEPALEELQGLADEMRPALRDFAAEMGPAMRDLLAEVEDWSVYHPPEMMPNGDIILRRKTPDEMGEDPAAPEGEVEL